MLGSEQAPAVSQGTSQRPRRHLGQALLVAALLQVVILVGNVLAAVLTEWTGRLSWLAAPIAAVVVAMGKLLVEEYAGRPRPTRSAPPPLPEQRRHRPGPPPAYPEAPQRRGSLLVALVVVVALLGGVGYAVTAGVRYATGLMTGNEPGVERLVAPVETTSSGLRLGVDGVVHTAHFTRVGVVVQNGTSNTLTLPLFGNAHLVAPDGTTLEADPFRSDFSDTVPPGSSRRGTLVFDGHAPEGATTLQLSFATVFARGFDGPRSITLSGIAVRPLAESAAAESVPASP